MSNRPLFLLVRSRIFCLSLCRDMKQVHRLIAALTLASPFWLSSSAKKWYFASQAATSKETVYASAANLARLGCPNWTIAAFFLCAWQWILGFVLLYFTFGRYESVQLTWSLCASSAVLDIPSDSWCSCLVCRMFHLSTETNLHTKIDDLQASSASCC